MKKTLGIALILIITLVGCGSTSLKFSVEKAPQYKDGESFPFEIAVSEKGEGLPGMNVVATLEMEKMDHGVIKVNFVDNGDGVYTTDVELPMGGEWLAHIDAEYDGKTYDDLLTFDVKEK